MRDDELKFLQLAEEVSDQVVPFLYLKIDRDQPSTVQILENDDLFAALIEVGDDRVDVEGFVAEEPTELGLVDLRGDIEGVEAHQVAIAHEHSVSIAELPEGSSTGHPSVRKQVRLSEAWTRNHANGNPEHSTYLTLVDHACLIA